MNDLGAATLDGLGGWSFTTAALSDSSHSFTAKATDNGGNTTTTSAVTAITDTTPPSSLSTQTLDLLATSDSGSSNTDNITKITTPTIQVSSMFLTAMSVGDVIQIIDTSNGNVVVGSHTVVSSDLFSFSASHCWINTTQNIVLNTLNDGLHNLKVELVDLAGNVGTASTATLAVSEDTTAPTVCDHGRRAGHGQRRGRGCRLHVPVQRGGDGL